MTCGLLANIHTDTQSHYCGHSFRVSEFFLQYIIKDRPKNGHSAEKWENIKEFERNYLIFINIGVMHLKKKYLFAKYISNTYEKKGGLAVLP